MGGCLLLLAVLLLLGGSDGRHPQTVQLDLYHLRSDPYYPAPTKFVGNITRHVDGYLHKKKKQNDGNQKVGFL